MNNEIGSEFILDKELGVSSDIKSQVKNVTRDGNVDRLVTPNKVQKKVNQLKFAMWETDPKTLQDYADNVIVQSFIDTLAKDVASMEWTIEGEDGEEVDLREQFLQIHPEKSWSDLIESTVRDLLETGNSFWIIHYYENSSEIAEVVNPDPATMYKNTTDGITEEYGQISNDRNVNTIPAEQVVHFEWGSSSRRMYSKSPVEDSLDVIEIIDELQLKEILDLVEGGQSGILTQTSSHDTHPMDSQEWNDFSDQIVANEGERHKMAITRGDYDWVSIDTSYDELKLMERYKFHIQTLGSAFKVSPSYAGFNFDETNRATDESQRESYKRKGVNVVMTQLQERINRDLMSEFGDAKFKWVDKDSFDTDTMEHYESLATAVRSLRESGIPVSVEDDNIVIPQEVELDAVELKSVIEAEEFSKLTGSEFSIQQESEESTGSEEEKDFEACVESVLADNPSLSEDEAEAICATKDKDKKELMKSLGNCSGFDEALETLENVSSTRHEAFEKTQELIGKNISKSKYYDWLDECGLRE